MVLRSTATLLDAFGDSVWRADLLADAARVQSSVLASGHAALDAQLPGGGWPVGGLCEILQAPTVHQEWRLLLPALAGNRGKLVLVGAPYVPFGPALSAQGLDARALVWVKTNVLAERLWAAEQALRCAGVAALLLWLPSARSDHLRRLQLAAQSHAKLLFVMRPAATQHEASPAVLRLLVESSARNEDGLSVQLLKRRGPPLAQTLTLPARHAALSALLAVSESALRGADQSCLERNYVLDRLAAAA